MKELFTLLLLIIGAGLGVASVITSYFLPNQKIWFPVLCGTLCGLCIGIYMNGFPLGLLSGLLAGIVINLLLIPSGLLDKNRRNKGKELLRRFDKF